MNNEQYSLSKPMLKVIAVWLCAHDKADVESTISLATIVECLTEVGILRQPRRLIWRAIKRTKLQSRIAFEEIPQTVFCILLVCKPARHWIDSASFWIAKNYELLVEKKALPADALSFAAISVRE
jgi:hypothetical protein